MKWDVHIEYSPLAVTPSTSRVLLFHSHSVPTQTHATACAEVQLPIRDRQGFTGSAHSYCTELPVIIANAQVPSSQSPQASSVSSWLVKASASILIPHPLDPRSAAPYCLAWYFVRLHAKKGQMLVSVRTAPRPNPRKCKQPQFSTDSSFSWYLRPIPGRPYELHNAMLEK
jgi:hypothetical protein